MPSVGFEPTISADERQQTYALDCARQICIFSPLKLRVFTAAFRCDFHDLVLISESESFHERRGKKKPIIFRHEIIPVFDVCVTVYH